MVLAEVEQAVTTGRVGPRQLCLMATWPAAMLAIMEGTMKGETRPGPCLTSFSVLSVVVLMPPMPEPTYTPRRSWSTAPSASRPESAMASSEAARAKRT